MRRYQIRRAELDLTKEKNMGNEIKERVNSRIMFVLPKKDRNRLTIKWYDSAEPVIRIDLHEMKFKEADRLITNIIAVMEGPFTFDIIHGYNHGTVLKEYIHNDLESARILRRYCKNDNPGETYLKIA